MMLFQIGTNQLREVKQEKELIHGFLVGKIESLCYSLGLHY